MRFSPLRGRMFLFTDPTPGQGSGAAPQAAAAGSAATPVVDAIRRGAAQSGTSFDYLLATAQKESALDPAAKAPTSSASGLFQFIEQTWLGLVKSDGGSAGLGDMANAITTRSDGSLAVSDPATKQAILKLREDPLLSAAMAGTLTQKNGASLQAETGRAPSAGDLYAAHVLGARGAADLINTAATDPNRVAALDFPAAASANRGIFYDRSGRPRGAAEVYSALTAAYTGMGAPTTSAQGVTASAALGTTQPGPALSGLFQTGARPGPVSDAVAKIWRVNNGIGSNATAVRFFPRDGGAVADAAAADAAPSGTIETSPAVSGSAIAQPSVIPPLPPPRPRFASDAVSPPGLRSPGNFLAASVSSRRSP